MIQSLVPLYGRIDGSDAPNASPEDFMTPGGGFIVGCDDDGRAVCGGGVKRLADDVCEIKRMYVVEDLQGRGVGRALLAALEDAARDLGYRRVRLDTGARQPHAEALYRSAGYSSIPNYNANRYATFWGEKEL